MPIHRERYRRRDGTARTYTGRAWMVICVQGLRALVRKRAFVYLMLLAWIPCIVRAVQIYVVANFPQASFLAVSARDLPRLPRISRSCSSSSSPCMQVPG